MTISCVVYPYIVHTLQYCTLPLHCTHTTVLYFTPTLYTHYSTVVVCELQCLMSAIVTIECGTKLLHLCIQNSCQMDSSLQTVCLTVMLSLSSYKLYTATSTFIVCVCVCVDCVCVYVCEL